MSNHPHRGFTLLELLVVLCIITVIMAVATPHLAGRAHTAALHGAGFDVQTMASAARARAVLSGEVLILTLANQGKTLRLISLSAAGEDINIMPPRQLPEDIKAQFTHYSDEGTLPERIRFGPDGTADGGELRLINGPGDELKLQLITSLGRLQWMDPA